MKIRSKKGVVEAQFNWIFILIVGGVILLFFISMVKNSSESSKITLASDLLNNLDSITKGSAISIGTVYDIDMPPDQSLDNKCTEDEKLLTFYRSGLEGIDMKYNTLFAPSILSGNKLYTYSLYWQVPFIVMPFLYMTTDNSLFLVVDNTTGDEAAEAFYEELPLNDDPDLYDDDGNKVAILKSKAEIDFIKQLLEMENNYYSEINIIMFDSIPSIENLFDDIDIRSKAKISIYEIRDVVDPEDIEGAFKVYYHEIVDGEIKPPDGFTGAFGIASLLALIFSEDKDIYECNMEKALFKYDIMLDIYTEKARHLMNYTDENDDYYHQRCPQLYLPGEYEAIKSELEHYGQTPSMTLNDLFDSIESSVQLLRQNNINLGDISCPIPY